MSNLFTARIVLGSAIILAIAAAAIGATFAFFNDLETSPGNTFNAGEIDLKIDNTSYYNGVLSPTTTWTLNDLTDQLFFDFHDLKPGDLGEDTISIHIGTNNSWACFDTELTTNDDNQTNDLEIEAGDTEDVEGDLLDGELGDLVNFTFWADDGDNVFESDETDNVVSTGTASEVLGNLSATLADSVENMYTNQPNNPLSPTNTYYIAKAWCFGDLTNDPVAQDGFGPLGIPGQPGSNGPDFRGAGFDCDGSGLDNVSQTDKLTADIHFSAIQSVNNDDFVCDEVQEFSCEGVSNPVFGASIVSNFQGRRKNGTVVLATRQNPSTGLVPQTTGTPFDPIVTEGTFYALGFPHANNANTPGEIVVDMGVIFYNNVIGGDLKLWEVTGGTSYPVETTQVYAKLALADGWTPLGPVSRDGEVNISPLAAARYVKLVEASIITPFEATADGYDLDGIQALCTQIENQ